MPTSGKTTRAKQLERYLAEKISSTTGTASSIASPQQPRYRLHYISDTTLSISRAVYDLSVRQEHTRSANASEKDARAAMYGAVKRVLSDRDIVVLDGPNYIKGWRYQLHCEAKAVRTPSAILQIGCSVDKAREINEKRLHLKEEIKKANKDQVTIIKSSNDLVGDDEPYAIDNWDNLVFRYEEPNAMNRWDSPLFVLTWEDGDGTTKKVFDDLWEAIAGENRKVIKPNQATVQRTRDADGDYLYFLDRETQDIVKKILEQQGDEAGGIVRISRSGSQSDLELELPMSIKLGLPHLQRHRRAFMGLNRGGIGLEGVGTLSTDRIRESFIGYLSDIFEKDG